MLFKIDARTSSSSIDSQIVYSAKTLFGREEPLQEVFARSLLEKLRIKFKIQKSILVTIGLPKEQLNNKTLKLYEDLILSSLDAKN
jgi:hypothetical protein